jgi:hypothetical protein
MRYVKIIGLTVAAAMVLAMFVGASAASATVLCKESITSGCAAAGQAYPAGTVLQRSLEGSSVLSSNGNTLNTCTGGQFKSEITNAGGASSTVSGPNTTINFENCAAVVHTESVGSLEIHHIAGTDNGTVTESGTVTGNTIFGTNCLYESGTGKDLGQLQGGASPTLSINITVNEAEPKKFICPDTRQWAATFRVTAPTPLYISAS